MAGWMRAHWLQPADLQMGAEAHVCILSGLYGVLRPLDRMQPYRLEMGTALANPHGANLYQFWGTQIADYLNQRARQAGDQGAGGGQPGVAGILQVGGPQGAAGARGRLRVRGVAQRVPVQGHQLPAKRARGLMARYAVPRNASRRR